MKKETQLVAQQLKYRDLLQQSQKEKDEQQVEFQVEEAQQQLQADVLATKRSLASSKQVLQAAKSARPFDSQAVINAQLQIEGLEDGLNRLNGLLAELF